MGLPAYSRGNFNNYALPAPSAGGLYFSLHFMKKALTFLVSCPLTGADSKLKHNGRLAKVAGPDGLCCSLAGRQFSQAQDSRAGIPFRSMDNSRLK